MTNKKLLEISENATILKSAWFLSYQRYPLKILMREERTWITFVSELLLSLSLILFMKWAVKECHCWVRPDWFVDTNDLTGPKKARKKYLHFLLKNLILVGVTYVYLILMIGTSFASLTHNKENVLKMTWLIFRCVGFTYECVIWCIIFDAGC